MHTLLQSGVDPAPASSGDVRDRQSIWPCIRMDDGNGDEEMLGSFHKGLHPSACLALLETLARWLKAWFVAEAGTPFTSSGATHV